MKKVINVETIANATKKEIVDFLRTAKVADKTLAEAIKTALASFDKDMNSVKKSFMVDLAQKVFEVPAPKEASLKPKSKDKKSSGTKSSKKSEESEDIETIPPMSNVGVDNLPFAKTFPAVIDHPELGKLVSCAGEFTSYDEVLKALEDEETLYLACYWTKRQIREFDYENTFSVEAPAGGFDFDLDILSAVLPCTNIERVFAMSLITEAMYMFDGGDFEPIQDKDPRSGEEFSVRVSGGVEFEVYRPEEDEDEE